MTSLTPNIVEVISNKGMMLALNPGTATVKAVVEKDGISKEKELSFEVLDEVLASDKTRSTIYTPEKIANARANIQKYDTMRNLMDKAVSDANMYLQQEWDYWWHVVPPHTLPTSYAVNQPKGSPVSGLEINNWGNYPYRADPFNEPWKLIDPSATDGDGEFYRYPTNDFAKYYESALDEFGIFQPGKGDPAYLVNELYPEKGPTWGVDDGYGWVDEEGNTFTFIAYYSHWFNWYSTGVIQKAIVAFRDAYLYTGEAKYAQAGIVLLDRIADVYPSLDLRKYDRRIFWHSDMSNGLGKAVGSIWETFLVEDFMSAYDVFFPAMDRADVMDDVLLFLMDKGERYKLSFKDSSAGIRKNIEDGILREVYEAVKVMNIFGNTGMHQKTLAMAAVILDTLPETKDWLDFDFQSGGIERNPLRLTGGNILTALVNDVDRDGHGFESAPGYNALWLREYLAMADVLHGYDKYPEADLYDNVKLRKMFLANFHLTMLDRYTPSIGDSGKTGSPNLILDRTQMIKAFEVYGDPIFAQAAYFLNHNQTAGIMGNVFSEDPEQISRDIEAVIAEHGPLPLESTNLTGYGFTALRDGERAGANANINYFFPHLEVVENSIDYRIFESNNTVQLEALQPDHFITFEFLVASTSEYDVLLRPWRADTYGKYEVWIDNEWITDVDFFGSSKEVEQLTTMELSSGLHQIKFINKGAESNGKYKMGVTELQLRDTSNSTEGGQTDTMRAMWMYYGQNDPLASHGHSDTLNLGFLAYGMDLTPDLGYPNFADAVDMHRAQWVVNTISHNTVVVDKKRQQPQRSAIPIHFDGSSDYVQLIDVEAPQAYTQTEQYRRSTAMIKVDDEHSYGVDFFKVVGGNDHHFSFHSMEGEVSVEGLQLTPQQNSEGQYVGTYAGEDVAFGNRVDDVAGKPYAGSGFHWLKDVDRDDQPSEQFSVDWNVKDTWNVLGNGIKADTDVHLRLTMLTPLDDVALANGQPPNNKPGNPEVLRYFIGHREGGELNSLFTSVIEPYRGERYIESIEAVSMTLADEQSIPIEDGEGKAVKVTLKNGRTDYIIYASDTDAIYRVDDRILFKGFMGVYSEQDDEGVYQYLHDASWIGLESEVQGNSQQLLDAIDALAYPVNIKGTVVDFTKQLSVHNTIDIALDLQNTAMDSLIGTWLYIEPAGSGNAVYEIKAITKLGEDLYRASIGDITLIRSFVDDYDFSKEYLYDIAEGSGLSIPLTHEIKRNEEVPNPDPDPNPGLDEDSEEEEAVDQEDLGEGKDDGDDNTDGENNEQPDSDANYPKQCSSLAWNDISDHWAKDTIIQARESCVTNGYSDHLFMPDQLTTRAEFIVMLVRALSLEGTKDVIAFKDAESFPEWAVMSIAHAAKLGIVNGYEDGTFRPNQVVSRAEMVTMLMRTLNIPNEEGEQTTFVDAATIPDWAKGYVAEAVKRGIVDGMPGNRFAPNESATRAQSVTVIMRALN